MKDKLIIIGAGGHARSVLDILIENNTYEIVGCIDQRFDTTRIIEVLEGIEIIGNDLMLQEVFNSGVKNAFVAIGDNALRWKLFGIVKGIGFKMINAISSHAYVSRSVTLGEGICIMPGAVVSVNCILNDAVIVNTLSSIDHDCVVGFATHIAPGVNMSGTVKLDDMVHVGTGSSIIDGVHIGKYSYVGCGAAVVSDIPSDVLTYGVPARIIKKRGLL